MENQENIKEKAVTGTAWKFLERCGAQIITLIVSIIIARLLNPEDYSVVTIILIFFAFANVLISGGLNTALIQKKDSDENDYTIVLFASVIVSFLIYLLLFFLAPLFSIWFESESLCLMIRIMGIVLPISALKSVLCAYVSIHLKFKLFFFATLIGTIVSGIIGIAMAMNGCGAWALIAQQMSNAIIDTLILLLTVKIKFSIKLDFKRFPSLFKFGWKVLVSSLINTAYSETVPLIIGIRYTNSDLSYYSKGKSFPTTAEAAINDTISSVFFPVISKFQNNKEKVLKGLRLFMRLSSYLIFPVMVGMFFVSDEFVMVVLTEKWMGASIYIRIFCVSSLFSIIATGNCQAVKAIGKSDVFLIMEIIKKTLYLVIILLFLFLSNSPIYLAISAAVCSTVAILVNSFPNVFLLGYKYKQQLFDLLPNLILSLIMGGIVYLVGFIPISQWIILLLKIVIGVVTYLGLSILTKNKSYSYIIHTIKEINEAKHKKTINQ